MGKGRVDARGEGGRKRGGREGSVRGEKGSQVAFGIWCHK